MPKQKLKYEKPVLLELGEMGGGVGRCANGSSNSTTDCGTGEANSLSPCETNGNSNTASTCQSGPAANKDVSPSCNLAGVGAPAACEGGGIGT